MATLKETIERALFNRPNSVADDQVIFRQVRGRPGTAVEQIVSDIVDSLEKQEQLAEQASTVWMKQESLPDGG